MSSNLVFDCVPLPVALVFCGVCGLEEVLDTDDSVGCRWFSFSYMYYRQAGFSSSLGGNSMLFSQHLASMVYSLRLFLNHCMGKYFGSTPLSFGKALTLFRGSLGVLQFLALQSFYNLSFY